MDTEGTGTEERVNESVFDAAVEETVDDGSQQTVDDNSQQQTQQPAQATGVDPDAIARAVAEGMSRVQQTQPAAPQQTQLSEDEIKERLKEFSYKPDFAKALVEELRADEPDVEAIAALLNTAHSNQMQQAQTYAYLVAQMVKQELSQQVQPAIQYVTQAQKTAAQERFFKNYPELKTFEQLMPMVASQLYQSGQLKGDEKQDFENMAKTAESLIKASNPNFKLGTKTQQAKQQGASKPNNVSFGGQGGAGGGSGQQTKGSSIWD